MITATILGGFEDTLSQVALLAAFIPIISGMSGNSGTQSLAVSVRNISNGDIKEKSKLKIALKEAGSGLITGFVCSDFILNYCHYLSSTILGTDCRCKFNYCHDSRYVSRLNDSNLNE